MTEAFDVFSNKFSQDIFLQKYSMDGKETWKDTCTRVINTVVEGKMSDEDKQSLFDLMYARKFIPAGRYLYATGRPFHQVNNCFLFRAEDSREGWADAMHKASMSLMTGGGIGFDYSAVRHEGALIKKTGGTATGPLALMHMVNEAGRHIMQGGARRSAIWAGLNWNHPDIFKFMKVKNYSDEIKALKEKDFTFPVPMEITNISVAYDTAFWDAIDQGSTKAQSVWMENCRQSFSTAEPGMSFNWKRDKESLRNACTEVTSEDDSDKCNLGTLWINRFTSIDELRSGVRLATLFLLAGGEYSHLPTDRIRDVGEANNRIGLGMGGMHEWLMLRNSPYEVTPELHEWLAVYRDGSDEWAEKGAKSLGQAVPKGVRAIAPNGTIGIISESTTGIEPLFCKSYKRRYFKGGKWEHQFVIDGTVKRLMEKGVPIEAIQDSYDISFEDRIKFQADVQDYVDMAISSTCNMDSWGSETNNESLLEKNADILFKYSKRLRGFTTYPDGCRGGQPLTRVPLSMALKEEGKVYREEERECINGVCGL